MGTEGNCTEARMTDLLRSIANFLTKLIVRMRDPRPKSNHGVLIVKLEVLGDFILFLPTLKYYRNLYPNRPITLLVDNRLNETIAKRYQEQKMIDEVQYFDSKKFIGSAWYRLSFSLQLHKRGYSTAIYHAYYRRLLGDFLIDVSGAAEKIGFAGFRFDKCQDKRMMDIYTRLIHVPKAITTEYGRNKYFMEQLLARELTEYCPEFLLRDEDKTHKLVQPYAVIFPGAGQAYRKWPAERFARVCEYILSTGVTPVIAGSMVDKDATEAVVNALHIEARSRVIDYSGKTNIFEFGSLLAGSIYYLGNETGAVHLAVAVKCPTFCIMGGGVLDIFFPYGDPKMNHSIFWKDMPCRDDEWRCAERLPPDGVAPCIAAITVEQVINELP